MVWELVDNRCPMLNGPKYRREFQRTKIITVFAYLYRYSRCDRPPQLCSLLGFLVLRPDIEQPAVFELVWGSHPIHVL